MLNGLKKRAGERQVAQGILAGTTARARLPVFYESYGVADTIDGRFDLLVLHVWLVLERLAAQKLQGLSQALVDALFVQFDEALREQGAGDMAMGRRMTKMADAFYGRLKAYGEVDDEAALANALQRNVFRGDASKVEQARALAMYVGKTRRHLSDTDLSQGVEFGPAP